MTLSNVPSKTDMRKRIRRQRALLPDETHQKHSKIICDTLLSLPEFTEAQHIAVYYALGHEVNLDAFMQAAYQKNKQLYLSAITKDNNNIMHYYPFNENDPLKKNRYGIYEPDQDALTPVPHEQLDLIIIPLVAFDYHLNRLGQGAGFYDRFLSQYPTVHDRPMLVGVAYEFQKVERIPTDQWDIRLDRLVTEKEIYSKK